jgi:hypothetical protein
MPNENPIEAEIFASKVDPLPARKKNIKFYKVLTLKAGTGKVAGNKRFHGMAFS